MKKALKKVFIVTISICIRQDEYLKFIVTGAYKYSKADFKYEGYNLKVLLKEVYSNF